MADSRNGQEIYKNLKNFVLSKSKKVLRNISNSYVKGTWKSNERALNGQTQNNLSSKINKAVLDYNPTYEIIIHDPILAKIND